MILTRSPLRITFGGGGTDLFSYANNYGGFCVSACISKYVYVSANHAFQEGIILKYSDYEHAKTPDDIRHPILKEAFKEISLKTPQIELISIADVPSNGAGLGNSGAFSVALMKTLYAYKNITTSPEYVADIACEINIERLGKIQGKQDEYISAIGGIQALWFNKDGSVTHKPLNIKHETLVDLEENLLLFYTGISHNTDSILGFQNEKTNSSDEDMIKNLHKVKDIGFASYSYLESGMLEEFALTLNRQWELKEQRLPEKNQFLKNLHYDCLENGALGSKIIGSGNGGFILCYSQDKNSLRKYMRKNNLQELRFTFDFEGCKRMI